MGVVTYNDGQCGLLNVMNKMGLQTGQHSLRAYIKLDYVRVELSVKRNNELEKKKRQSVRQQRMKKEEDNINNEGVTYEAGGF